MLKKVSNIVKSHFSPPKVEGHFETPLHTRLGGFCLELLCATVLVILLQVVMVSRGTHLVKNRESQS